MAVIVQGPSSSGKSYVIERVARLFPAEAVLMATDITPNALYYLPPGEMEHRFVVAGERSRHHNDESAQTTKALREMISSGQLVKVHTISDPEGPRTVTVQQQGPIAYAESTTAPEVFEEDANRCLILQPDERPEQTRRILAASGRHLSGQSSAGLREQWWQEFHALQRLLESLPVVIPFSENLALLFPSEPLEVRRTFGHVTSMIQASALLHQLQRPRDEAGRIVAQPEDYWLAQVLLSEVLARSLGRKSADALKRFVKRLRDFTGEHTAKELSQAMNVSERTVREHLHALLELGAIEQTAQARGPIPAKWLIHEDIPLCEQSETPLPSIEAVCGVDEETLSLSEMPADWPSADSTDVPF
ncbi:MAG: helix-turn-helix domain-containing protein [Candidatus Saccharimonas sp.]|nr:helix-turn-helix domain-containing protein [Planctomycetaceae bacterium]